MTIVHRIQLDLKEPQTMPQLRIREGEAFTRQVAVELFDGGEPWPVPDNAAPVIRYRILGAGNEEVARGIYDTMPDGEPAWEKNGNLLTLTLAPAMMASAGQVFADVVLVAGAELLATGCFRIDVEQVPAEGSEPEAQSYYRLFTLGQINSAYNTLAQQQQALEETCAALQSNLQRLDENKVNVNDLPQLTEDKVSAENPTVQGDLQMNNHRIRGLADPGFGDDAAPKSYVDGRVANAVVHVPFVDGEDGLIHAQRDYAPVCDAYQHGAVVFATYGEKALQAHCCLGNAICFVNRNLGDNTTTNLWFYGDGSVIEQSNKVPVSRLTFTGMADVVYDGTRSKEVHLPRCVPLPYEAEIGQVLAVAELDDDGIPSEWIPVDLMVVNSSTPGSTKRFRITVDDSGSISALEV